MISLTDKERTIINQVANQCLDESIEVWAFGSRVKGTHHESSDLDLVVHAPPNMKATELNQIVIKFRERLKDSYLPILVDVLIWSDLPKSYQDNILSCYEIMKF